MDIPVGNRPAKLRLIDGKLAVACTDGLYMIDVAKLEETLPRTSVATQSNDGNININSPNIQGNVK